MIIMKSRFVPCFNKQKLGFDACRLNDLRLLNRHQAEYINVFASIGRTRVSAAIYFREV